MTTRAASVATGSEACRSGSVHAGPAVAETVSAIPTEVSRSVVTEVRPRAPSPNPRRSDPRPTVNWVIDVGVRVHHRGIRVSSLAALVRHLGALIRSLAVCVRCPVGRFVGVLGTIGHPDPAVLRRIDPLTCRWRLFWRRRLDFAVVDRCRRRGRFIRRSGRSLLLGAGKTCPENQAEGDELNPHGHTSRTPLNRIRAVGIPDRSALRALETTTTVR